MYKQHNDSIAENKEKHTPALQDGIAEQLLNAYAVGIQAIKEQEPELADIISYHIFDLLDWVRKNQSDIQGSFAKLTLAQRGCDSKNSTQFAVFPTNIQELEALVDEKFCSNSYPLEAVALSKDPLVREPLC